MSNYPIADVVGVTKRAIKKALQNGISERELFKFIHGNTNVIFGQMPKPSSKQRWETTGKRYVHLEEAQFVARHLLRNNIKPSSRRALVLSGANPAMACLPWAMSGLACSFDAYEKNWKPYYVAKSKLEEERKVIEENLLINEEAELNLFDEDCLDAENMEYGVLDLDFCSNQLRTPSSRSKILALVDRTHPEKGPFVLRTTLHVGRIGNSLSDIETHIDSFEKGLREGQYKFRIRAHNRSPYQSSLPMISLVWILERKETISYIIDKEVKEIKEITK